MASFVTNHKNVYDALSSAQLKDSLAGKTVFITGAGRGVGEHLARSVARAGAAKLGILGRDKSRIEKAKQTLSEDYAGTKCVSYAADITDEAAIAACFKDFGPVDILINNAGHFPDDGPFIKQDLKQWFTGFEINILGTAVVTQKFLQAKEAGRTATVLTTSSMAAHMRFPLVGWAGYNSSKLGQARIFENLRFEHPEVRFLNIHPGNIESDGFTRSGASAPPDGMTDGELAGQFFVWAATEEAEFLNGRFVWAEWDVEELKAKKDEILEKDLLLSTIDGFDRGFF